MPRETHTALYSLYRSFKAFNLVSRSGHFQFLNKIACPPQLLSIIASFHDDMKDTVNFDGTSSKTIKRVVKQGCVLAPTLFGTFLVLLLNVTFRLRERHTSAHQEGREAIQPVPPEDQDRDPYGAHQGVAVRG